MKHKHTSSPHVILVGIIVILIGVSLTFFFYQNLNHAKSSQNTQTKDSAAAGQQQNYVKLEEWRVRFASDAAYTLKLNSNKTTYFISSESLAKTCSNPDTPWLGIIQRFEDPEEKQTLGPNAGKTMKQIVGSRGKIINGKLYHFDIATQFCTRNTSNPEIEQAAKKLEAEINSLEAY